MFLPTLRPALDRASKPTTMAPIAIEEEGKNGVAEVLPDIKRFNQDDGQKIDLVLRQFRCLIADLCQQFNGGHPG